MSNEWVEEVEFSPKEIHIHAPSSTIQCKIGRSWENVLYNPTVGANLMSTSYALAYVGNGPFAPTNRSLRLVPRSSMESLGVLHGVNIYHGNTIVALDFHVFNIQDFNILIGHPLEKLFIQTPSSGDLDRKLGRDTFSIPITRAKNSVADTLHHHKPPKKVISVSPFESPESSLEKDAKLFIEGEDDLGKTINLPQEEALT